MGFEEIEVLDHRMRAVAAEFAGDAQQHLARLRPAGRKFNLALADIRLDIVEPFQKIDVPGDAPVLAVGHGFQSDRFLLLDHTFDFAIFDHFEVVLSQLAARALLARLFQGCSTQKAADMVGAKWRLATLTHASFPLPQVHFSPTSGHKREEKAAQRPHTSPANSTIMRSFAHCSSSASTLPSSVEAKPHCGDRHS